MILDPFLAYGLYPVDKMFKMGSQVGSKAKKKVKTIVPRTMQPGRIITPAARLANRALFKPLRTMQNRTSKMVKTTKGKLLKSTKAKSTKAKSTSGGKGGHLKHGGYGHHMGMKHGGYGHHVAKKPKPQKCSCKC